MNSNVAQNHILNRYFGSDLTAPPSIWYVAFFYGDPSVTGTSYANEFTTVIGPGYSRTAVANDTNEWTNTGLAIENAEDIICCEATADWSSTVKWVGLFDSADLNTGNLYFYQQLSIPKQIQDGTTIIFKAGSFVVTNPNS